MELRLGARVGVEADGTVVEKVWIRFDVTGAVTDDEHNDQHKKKKVLHFLLHYEMYVTKCNRKNLTSKMTPIFQTDQELFTLRTTQFHTVLLCCYVADPATFLEANSVRGTLFSSLMYLVI